MNQLTIEEIKEVVAEVVHSKAPGISAVDHKAHHAYIGMQIAKDERSQERWEKFRLSLIGTIATLLVTGTVWLGKVALEIWRH